MIATSSSSAAATMDGVFIFVVFLGDFFGAINYAAANLRRSVMPLTDSGGRNAGSS